MLTASHQTSTDEPKNADIKMHNIRNTSRTVTSSDIAFRVLLGAMSIIADSVTTSIAEKNANIISVKAAQQLLNAKSAPAKLARPLSIPETIRMMVALVA